MTTHTKTYQLDTDLLLRDSSLFPLTVHAVTLTLTKQDDTLIESRLTFQVTPELYQRIDTEALFNLKPELRGSLTAGEFISESNIEITASLKPDLLTHFTPTSLMYQLTLKPSANNPKILFYLLKLG